MFWACKNITKRSYSARAIVKSQKNRHEPLNVVHFMQSGHWNIGFYYVDGVASKRMTLKIINSRYKQLGISRLNGQQVAVISSNFLYISLTPPKTSKMTFPTPFYKREFAHSACKFLSQIRRTLNRITQKFARDFVYVCMCGGRGRLLKTFYLQSSPSNL